jgi:hypothetical protein
MLTTLSRSILLSLLLVSLPSFADFNIDGKLKLTYPYDDEIKELPFPLSYSHENDDHTFSIGPHTFQVTGQPESYSFALILKDNNFVWLQELSDREFESFSLVLGEHKLKLVKRILNKPVKGDYILTIDGVDYFFNNTLTQINFTFDDDGIAGISVYGMIASLGMNKAKNPCDEFDKGSEEQKKCELND